MKLINKLFLCFMVLVALQACTENNDGSQAIVDAVAIVSVSPEEARDIAKQAYIYGFPLVMGYKTIYNYAVDKENPEYKGPLNHLSCTARLFTPEDKAIVTPNADTPYCMFWMDLRTEPLVLTVPEMDPERFYQFQLIDLYTHNFAYVGTLTSGNGSGEFLLAGPDWDGEKPEGITDVIRSETSFIFNITRTQLFGSDDLAKVKEIQGSYNLQSLSAFLGKAAPAAASTPDFPVWVEGSQFDERMFSYLDFMLSLLEKPLKEEKPLWDRFARLGLGPQNTFNFSALPAQTQDAVKAGIKEGFGEIEQMLKEAASDPLGSAKVFGSREFLQKSAKEHYGHENHYLMRAAAGHIGLYGNSAAEAIYPTYLVDRDGQPYDASTNRYTLTFENGQFPPVKAFWSLTLYDGTTQLFIKNPLDRYLLNSSMMDQFKFEKDGSVVLHIAKNSPGDDLESNWLPAPDGPFYMVLRLYGPESKALEGEWTPPVLKKIKEVAQDSTPASQKSDSFEDQVAEYLRKFPYQDTSNYAMLYTSGDPAKLNAWVMGSEPALVKAGEDVVVRQNNDTYYTGAFLDLENGSVVLGASVPAEDRFYSFQLMDDRNANYRNIIHPKGEYTLYFGEKPEQIRGEAIDVPSSFSVVIVRVEVKDKDDPEDVAAAKAVFKGITLTGESPSEFPSLDLLSGYPADVTDEANRRMDEAMATVSFTDTIVGPGQEPGRDVPVLHHSAGTKGAWGGPHPSHSAYETIFFDKNGDEMMGSNGTYTVTTEEPPVDAFWSITVYDTDRGGFLHPNEDDRYHINNTAATRNDDGTVTFTFKQDCESLDLNCLEVPAGQFDLITRYYLPHDEVITGDWTWPKIVLQADKSE